MDTLDHAALRRFDLKISFGYLKQEQVFAQFVQTLSDMQHGAEIPATLPALLQQRLCHLTNLTPGDFAVVIRQSLMLGHHFNADNLVVASEEESPVRSGIQPNRSVAFCVRQDG